MKGDAKVIEFLNKALYNELTAINQYFLHAKMLKNWGLKELAEHEYHESIDEMKHADTLSERILFLDGLPNFQALGRLRIGENPLEVLRADLALELLDHRLDLGLHLAQIVGRDLVHSHTGRLELGDDVAVTLVEQLALQQTGFGRGLLDAGLVGGRERVPELLGGDERDRRVDVVGDGDVFLHLLHLVRPHVLERVLLSVERLDLERGEHLRERTCAGSA